MALDLYMDGKGTNCLSLGDCIWCDVCKEAMGKSTETESESETEYEDEMEGSEIEGSEEHEWSQSTIDGLEENMIVATSSRWRLEPFCGFKSRCTSLC